MISSNQASTSICYTSLALLCAKEMRQLLIQSKVQIRPHICLHAKHAMKVLEFLRKTLLALVETNCHRKTLLTSTVKLPRLESRFKQKNWKKSAQISNPFLVSEAGKRCSTRDYNIHTESMRDIPWQQHWSPIWSGIHDVCSHSIIKSHLTEGYISAYGRKSSKLYKYVAHLELPSVPVSFLDHCKNVTIVWEKSTYLANATNMYKLQRCIRLPWIACGTIQRQTLRHECSGSHNG